MSDFGAPIVAHADDEEFCSRCYAGIASSKHHERCVVNGYANDGESA